MAGGLASKGGADVGLSSVQHPTHAMPGHCTQRNEIISQLVAPYFAPSTSSPLPCKLDGQSWSVGSVASSHTSSETISPRSSCPCPEIFSIQNTPSFCCTSHYTLTFPYCTRAVPSDWSSARANILHSPRRDQSSWKILSWRNTGITAVSYPHCAQENTATLLLLAAMPQRELHQQ